MGRFLLCSIGKSALQKVMFAGPKPAENQEMWPISAFFFPSSLFIQSNCNYAAIAGVETHAGALEQKGHLKGQSSSTST